MDPWHASISQQERDAVVTKVTTFLHRHASAAAPENIRRVAAHIEAAAFSQSRSKQEYLGYISKKTQEVGQRTLAPSSMPAVVGSGAVPNSRVPVPTLPIPTAIPTSTTLPQPPQSQPPPQPTGMPTSMGKGHVAILNGQRFVVFTNSSTKMPVLILSDGEKLNVRQRLERLRLPLAKYHPLAQQMMARPNLQSSTADPFALIFRVGQLLQCQLDLLPQNDIFLNPRHLDRIEPQFLNACQQVELAIRSITTTSSGSVPSLPSMPVTATSPEVVAVTAATIIPPAKKTSPTTATTMSTTLPSTQPDAVTTLLRSMQDTEQEMMRHGKQVDPIQLAETFRSLWTSQFQGAERAQILDLLSSSTTPPFSLDVDLTAGLESIPGWTCMAETEGASAILTTNHGRMTFSKQDPLTTVTAVNTHGASSLMATSMNMDDIFA